MKRAVFLLSAALFFVMGCNTPSKTSTYTLRAVAFESAGPYFEGANTFTFSHTVDPSLLTDSAGFSKEHIASVRLVSAEISPAPGQYLDLFRSFSLALMGNASESLTAGVLNPIPTNAGQAQLGVSSESNLKAFFSEGTFYLVLDADLKADQEETITLLGNLVFEITF
jgi:hypothetical protein